MTVVGLRARELPARHRPLSREWRHRVSLQNGATPWWCSGVTSTHRRLVENWRARLLVEVASGERGQPQTALRRPRGAGAAGAASRLRLLRGSESWWQDRLSVRGGALPAGSVQRPRSCTGQAGGWELGGARRRCCSESDPGRSECRPGRRAVREPSAPSPAWAPGGSGARKVPGTGSGDTAGRRRAALYRAALWGSGRERGAP